MRDDGIRHNESRGALGDILSVDLHCDALSSVRNGGTLARGRKSGHFDLPRMMRGGLWCQVLSIFVHPRWIPRGLWWRSVEKQMLRLNQALDAAPEQWKLAISPEQVMENYKNGVRSLVVEVEGLHAIEGDIDKIERLWEWGVRIFTLTWNNSNEFATSAMDARGGDDPGLTSLGREVCALVDQMGGIIDLSHSSDGTFYDVLEMGISPVLSHSCVRDIRENCRNASVDMIRSLGEAGGVVGINLFPGFLSNRRYSDVSSADVVEHISASISAGGENVAAIGSDFDGVKVLPNDIADAADFMRLAEKMVDFGFSRDIIEKVMGRNFLNYWLKRSSSQ